MDMEAFAARVEAIRPRLYRTALCYFGDATAAADVLDEAVYRGLCASGRLQKPEFFETWMTRILLNECHREQKRRSRSLPLEELPEEAAETLDHLPLKEALRRLPQELKDVVILRYFAGYTLSETAQALGLPQGTVVTRQRRALKLLRLELEEAEV